MTQPPRLQDMGTDFERDVLASARLDAGGDEGLKRTLVAVGVGAAAISTTAATAGAGLTAGTAGAAAGGATMLGGAGMGVLVKWVGVGVAVGVLGGGAAVSAASFVHHAPTHAALPLLPPRPGPPPPGRALASASPNPGWPAPVPPPTGTAAASSPPPSFLLVPPSAPPALPGARLQAEVATLDQVRLSLARGDAPDALRDLDAYDRAFPASLLADEATVLRVDALVAHGDRPAAAILGRRFLSVNPASPHAEHLLRILDGTR